jgi:hypothetical protein
LIVTLFLVTKTLRNIAEKNGIKASVKESQSFSIWRAFIKNQFLIFTSVILLLLSSAYFAYGYMMQIGVDQGYMPVQPIHYSHNNNHNYLRDGVIIIQNKHKNLYMI